MLMKTINTRGRRLYADELVSRMVREFEDNHALTPRQLFQKLSAENLLLEHVTDRHIEAFVFGNERFKYRYIHLYGKDAFDGFKARGRTRALRGPLNVVMEKPPMDLSKFSSYARALAIHTRKRASQSEHDDEDEEELSETDR